MKLIKHNWSESELELLRQLRDNDNLTWEEVAGHFDNATANSVRKAYKRLQNKSPSKKSSTKVKVLVLDIESSPLEVYCWGLFDQNIGLNQIKNDWSILSYSAKFIGSDKIYYEDTSKMENPKDDSKLLKSIWELMDEADIILGQNSVSFDVKKLNARFIQNGFPPPSSFRQIDTLKMAKKSFAFTSNKLEYMSSTLCERNQKSSHSKYPGFSLWKACLEGDKDAWKELKEYNIRDTLATEELYHTLAPWHSQIDFNVYADDFIFRCNCGSSSFKENGFNYTNHGKYKKLICKSCGKNHKGSINLLSKEKRKSMKR